MLLLFIFIVAVGLFTANIKYNLYMVELVNLTHKFYSTELPEEVETERSPSPTGIQSPVMDRNPSPPPDTANEKEDEDLDAIGDTVYSKHWLFSTLTRLIHVGRLLLLMSKFGA